MEAEISHNVSHLLKAIAARRGEREALVMPGGERIAYAELWDRVCRMSIGLTDRGFGHGDRAVLLVPMSIDLYAVLLSVVKVGGIAVFMDPWVTPRRVIDFCGFAEPRLLVASTRVQALAWLDPTLREIEWRVIHGLRFGPFPVRDTIADLVMDEIDQTVTPVRPDETALITFTTGSSGKPKGANRTHGFLIAQHLALLSAFPYEHNDVDMTMFPVFALNNLANGLTTVVPDVDLRHVERLDAARVHQQIYDHDVTTLTASPTFLDRLAEHRGASELGLRRILVGGAPVSDRALRHWQQAFGDAEIVVVYGSTEAEPVAHIGALERLELDAGDKPGYCLGELDRGLQAKIINLLPGPISLGREGWEDLEMQPGEVGELVVCGDHVGRDYYLNPEAREENKIVDPERDEVWHRMGDTGYFDDEGRFWQVGRLHSTIQRDGRLVHALLVEQAVFERVAEVRRVAALGERHDTYGQQVTLVVESEPATGLVARIRRALEEAGQPVDRLLLAKKPLPLDPRHRSKIDYAALAEQLANDPQSFAEQS